MQYSSYQEAIFNHVKNSSKNLMIIAYAGCAKTTSIVKAIDYTRPPVEKKPKGKYPPQNKLFMAFGKKIADELKNRVPKSCAVRTCHSYGYAALKYNWGNPEVDNTRNYRIVDKVVGEDYTHSQTLLKLVSLAKCDALSSHSFDEEFYSIIDEFALRLETKEEEQKLITYCKKVLELTLVQDKCVSYDDMIYIPAMLGFQAGKYEYIFVDETQDLNKCQLKLIRQAKKHGTKFVFCGDPNQAIFAFRKADMKSIPNIIKEFNCEVLTLPVTYRCGKKIVQLAKKYVPDYIAHETNEEGTINNILSREQLLDEVDIGDFVLSRKNAPLMKLCLSTLANGKPAIVAGKDIGEGLIKIVKKSKETSMPAFIKWLNTWKLEEEKKCNEEAEENPSAKEKPDEQSKSVLAQKLENIQDKFDCIMALSDDVYTVEQMLNKLETIFADTDDNLKTKIVYSSVHKAKGLEAEKVWVLQSTLKETNQEEKNICYVAYTRAKKVLNIVGDKF